MYTEAKYNKACEYLEAIEGKDDEQLVKSKQRVKDAGEVFTPRWVVRDMLDLDEIKDMSFELDTTFLEPACGNGNFIIQILLRKLTSVSKEAFDIDVARSVASIYGVDIAEDNVKETRARMMRAIKYFYNEKGVELRREIECSLWYILYRNIILGNTLDFKKHIEHYSPEELIESGAYSDSVALSRAKRSAAGISIVDTRTKVIDNGVVEDDLLVSEWKFMADGVHRSESMLKGMVDANSDLVHREYEAVSLDRLYTVPDKGQLDIEGLI